MVSLTMTRQKHLIIKKVLCLMIFARQLYSDTEITITYCMSHGRSSADMWHLGKMSPKEINSLRHPQTFIH